MRRALALGAVTVAAALAAAAATAALQDGSTPTATRTSPTTTTTGPTPGWTTTPPTTPSGPTLLLAWSQAGMPTAAVEAASAVPGVGTVAVVNDGRVDLVGSEDADGAVVDALDDGWRIPLDAVAVDPRTYAEVVPDADRAAVAGLLPGEAILGETSAELRGVGVGGRLVLADDTELAVVAVVPDESIGAAELLVDLETGAALGVDAPRAMLVEHDTDRAVIEAAVAATVGGEPVQFRAPGETPYLRAADAVLPQALVKAAFGEFAYRPVDDSDDVDVDPDWVAATIVEADVPVFGTVRCHRAIVEPLTQALAAVDAVGLGDELAALGYDGCFVPRFLRSGRSLSRHSWGVAVDIGFDDNRTGAAAPTLDERIVEAMRAEGFTWGGTWLNPDAAHFEIVQP